MKKKLKKWNDFWSDRAKRRYKYTDRSIKKAFDDDGFLFKEIHDKLQKWTDNLYEDQAIETHPNLSDLMHEMQHMIRRIDEHLENRG